VREEEKKGWSVLIGHFYTTLNLEVGRKYVIIWLEGGALESRGGAVPDNP
jgi:hypothetical protein